MFSALPEPDKGQPQAKAEKRGVLRWFGQKTPEAAARRKLTFKEAGVLAAAYCLKYPVNVLGAIVLALWIQWELFGFGNTAKTAWTTGCDPVSAVGAVLIVGFGLLRLSHAGRWKYGLAVIALGLSALLPLFEMTGYAPLVSSQNFDTLTGTNVTEAWGLLSSVPLRAWTTSLGYGVIYTAFVLIMKAVPVEKRSTGFFRQWKITASVCAVLLLPVITPFNDIAAGVIGVARLNLMRPAPTWHVTGYLSGDVPVKNYVVVMGESLSNKVLGLYGAPFDTTPFLSAVPTRRVEHFIAPSMATAVSVPFMTALADPEDEEHPAYENNILALAKEAGLTTYWLSAQGQAGAFEGRISYIARQADHTDFSARHDDLKLLSLVKGVLAKPEPQGRSRFVFVHTYGAHETTCDRVKDIGLPFKSAIDPFADCYLAAGYKADLVVKGIAEALAASGESWKMIFTADHAINMRRKADGEFVAYREANYQGQYEVPYVELGAGITTTEVVPGYRSAFDLPGRLAAWIGITTNLTPVGWNYTFPQQGEVRVLKADGKLSPFQNLKPSPNLAELQASVGP